MATLTALAGPAFAGSRPVARELFAALPDDLSHVIVQLDLSATKAVAPSFIDELIRLALVDRRAERLELLRASDRASELATRFAQNHGVAEHLRVAEPPGRRAATG